MRAELGALRPGFAGKGVFGLLPMSKLVSADSARRAAFSGWRRSWLIEVRTEDFRRLAASACCFVFPIFMWRRGAN